MLRLRNNGSGSIVSFGAISLLSLLALGTPGCSRERNSAQVASDVQNKIRGDSRMQMARVQVVAADGVVTLCGYVVSGEQRAATVQDAVQIEGVRTVIDNLRIVSSSLQGPAIALPKPSASVARLRSTPANRPKAATMSQTGVGPAARPAPEHRMPVTQTVAVDSAPIPVTSPARVPVVPVTPDRHALESRSPVANATVLPESVASGRSPATAVAPAAPEEVTIPGGTELVVRLNESLSSDINEKGDTFLASLFSPILMRDRIVIPAEAGVEGKVIEVQSAGRFSGRPKLAVEMTRLTCNGKTYDLRSSQYSKQGASRGARSVATIGGGAGVGAIIGAILGGGKGAAIGSVIGAGAGTGAQAANKAAQVKLPAESVLSFRLQAPLTVIPASSLQPGKRAGPGNSQDPFSSADDRPVLKRRPGSPRPDPDASEATPRSDNK